MTQEDKQLLLKDLCARLPYGVKCYPVITNGEPNIIGGYCEIFDDFFIREVGGWFNISMIKPYLRPLSSMTKNEQIYIWDTYRPSPLVANFEDAGDVSELLGYCIMNVSKAHSFTDWLNAHYFDYRGLIEKGLAFEAPEGMYKIK